MRIYTACYVTSTNVNNWLRTPYIATPENVKSFFIEIQFTVRRCTKHSDPSMLQQCKETFNLYYYEAESDFANDLLPTWDAQTYKKIDTIAADILYEDDFDITTQMNSEIKTVPINRRGLYFAFQDTGACVSLMSIKIYYITCPSMTVNFALFNETATGPNSHSLVTKVGVCVQNAVIKMDPQQLCKSDGDWEFATGGCVCSSGYAPTSDQRCVGE